MRIKTLLNYNLMTIKGAIIIFFAFFMAGTLLGSILSTVTGENVLIGMSTVTDGGVEKTWSFGLVACVIFVLISFLVGSQKDTRFLISRSVSRKEIFISNALFLVPLAAIMSVLQIVSIYIDGFVRYLLGAEFRGLELDVQIMQAPDMNNVFVFFAVSFGIYLSFGALSYLWGSLLARWKIPALGIFAILGVAFFSCFAIPGFIDGIIDVFTYMFTDDKSGLMITLKQIGFTLIVLAAVFPVMRRITAAKQSQ